MSSSIKKLYLEAIDTLLGELVKEHSQELDTLVQPIRYYLAEIERFSSIKLFENKVKGLVRTRDELYQKDHGQSEPLPTPKEVNDLLDQALVLLERGLASNETHSLNLAEITEKVRQAKSIASLRSLSETMLDAGNAFAAQSRGFQQDMSRIAVEISYSRSKIEQLEKELEQKSHEAERDALTGLLNRRAFDSELKRAMERSNRFRGPLALMLIDIDNFKLINDQYGHQVGDDVLRNFGSLLQKSLRDLDQTFRLGGDEFAVIFCASDTTKAVSIGNRMCEFVSKKMYSTNEFKFHTTISIGMTEFKRGEDERSLFKRADDLLYQAKKAGRNGLRTDIGT